MEDNKDAVVETVEKVEEETTQKNYTKEDIDASFNAGVKKANSEWQKDEKYKEFLEWKKSNQNDTERMKELETESINKDNIINDLKAQLELKDSDVKSEFVGFVKSEVLKATNDGVDFGTALKNFKKENPQYFGETVVTKVQSSPTLVGGTKPQTTNDIMNNLLRGK